MNKPLKLTIYFILLLLASIGLMQCYQCPDANQNTVVFPTKLENYSTQVPPLQLTCKLIDYTVTSKKSPTPMCLNIPDSSVVLDIEASIENTTNAPISLVMMSFSYDNDFMLETEGAFICPFTCFANSPKTIMIAPQGPQSWPLKIAI